MKLKETPAIILFTVCLTQGHAGLAATPQQAAIVAPSALAIKKNASPVATTLQDKAREKPAVSSTAMPPHSSTTRVAPTNSAARTSPVVPSSSPKSSAALKPLSTARSTGTMPLKPSSTLNKPTVLLAPGVTQSRPPQAKALTSPSVSVNTRQVKKAYKTPSHKLHSTRVPSAAHRRQVQRTHSTEFAQVQKMVNTLWRSYAMQGNQRLMSRTRRTQALDTASPTATVVTCANDLASVGAAQRGEDTKGLYVVKTIGNQVGLTPEPVNFGVRNLNSRLLIIIGNTSCPAVKEAASDYSALEPTLRKDLGYIDIPKGIDTTDGALLNVNNQVETAILTYSGEVESGQLAVIGAFYDQNNALKRGKDKLIITNLNGETNPKVIQKNVQLGKIFPRWEAE